MESNIHSMTNLFAQLGLPSTTESIQNFISSNSPIPGHIALHDAPFWSHTQSLFLRDKVLEDADWCGVINKLDVALRSVKG